MGVPPTSNARTSLSLSITTVLWICLFLAQSPVPSRKKNGTNVRGTIGCESVMTGAQVSNVAECCFVYQSSVQAHCPKKTMRPAAESPKPRCPTISRPLSPLSLRENSASLTNTRSPSISASCPILVHRRPAKRLLANFDVVPKTMISPRQPSIECSSEALMTSKYLAACCRDDLSRRSRMLARSRKE